MIRKLIKEMTLFRSGHTLTEALIVSVVAVILFTSALGVFVVTKTMYSSSIAAQDLQRDANRVLNRIVKGLEEGGVRYGLRSAVSYTIPLVTQIDFIGTDGNTRRYYLGSGGIVYESPTQSPSVQTIYTVPTGSTFTLRFWEPAGYLDHETVGVYISITKQASNRIVSGSLSTYVNVRNLPK